MIRPRARSGLCVHAHSPQLENVPRWQYFYLHSHILTLPWKNNPSTFRAINENTFRISSRGPSAPPGPLIPH